MYVCQQSTIADMHVSKHFVGTRKSLDQDADGYILTFCYIHVPFIMVAKIIKYKQTIWYFIHVNLCPLYWECTHS